MKKTKIGIMDSGIGGLFLLKELASRLSNTDFFYLGDNNNAPYGEKSKKELLHLSIKNALVLQKYDIDCLVLACNTLSLSVRNELENFLNIPVYGVYPPIESNLNNNPVLLSTSVTASHYFEYKDLTKIPLKYTVKRIELLAAQSLKNKKNLFLDKNYRLIQEILDNKLSEKICRSTLILGCTHFNFIKNAIINHFQPHRILRGEDYTVKMIMSTLTCQKISKQKGFNKITFIGETGSYNSLVYNNIVSAM